MNSDSDEAIVLSSILGNMRNDFMKLNEINELKNIMNQIKITNESTLHSAIRNKQYIIGSFNPATGTSFNTNPTVQYSIMQARAECRRLAKLYPGKTFFFVKLEGGEMTVPQPQSVSI
jgi:hypothetical protein